MDDLDFSGLKGFILRGMLTKQNALFRANDNLSSRNQPLKAHNFVRQGCFFFKYNLTTSTTN